MLKKFCSDTSAVPGRRIISFSIVAPGKVRSNFLSNRMRLLDLATRVMYLSLPWTDHIVVDADHTISSTVNLLIRFPLLLNHHTFLDSYALLTPG
jgi:hypothetical protein